MEIGIDSFIAATVDPVADRAVDPAKHLGELLEAIILADEVGLDVFGIGEHHRSEFLDSAPTVILAAAAARTRRIRLTSAVTVLSAADPVRVFQEFATLDLLSNGRAEIVVGRGSFIEAFPLFGLELKVGVHALGYVADSSTTAEDEFFPGYARSFTEIGRERGWPPMTRAHFDAQLGPTGALLLGDPETVAEKILRVNESLGGISRLTFQMSVAALPHAKLLRAIELLGTDVAPMVRNSIASETAAAPLLADSHRAA